ncbi:unnamed protein product [Phytophthora fragariaefolia]|uniref:Unnamed protein product n=1 Tax=Phytophthora fragariaefolia TaxID=1490495 RepID=A0A9W6XBX7_9STRA|nr:unnamed protein product [Phytophthora fragariaefolia]
MITSVVAAIVLIVATCCIATSEFTVLMYRDSSFEDYVGQVRFDSVDRCYPLCTDSEAVAAFIWDAEPHDTQLVVFDEMECQGRSIMGAKTRDAEFAAVALYGKLQSFILSTTGSSSPARGIVHSCDEKSNLVFEPFNDTTAWM